MTPRMALMRIGADRFALSLERVLHILPAPSVFPLPLIRAVFQGVFIYQGELVAQLEPAALLGRSNGECPLTVVYGTDLGLLGLPVDQILQIVELQMGTVEACEPTPSARFPVQNKFVYNGNEYPWLDVEALLQALPR